MLYDLTIKDFNSILASSAPAPGGGSAAALAGALASALSMMVYSLTTGKQSYAELDRSIKQQLELDGEMLKVLNRELMELVEEDTQAFNQVMQALRLSKQTEEERVSRLEKLQEANHHALQVPLVVAQKCLAILRHQVNIACYGNKNAVSDIGVGALLAYTGLESAVLNVRINISGIEVQNRIQTTNTYQLLLEEGKRLKEHIMGVVECRMED